jgi:hypothetical protein
MFHLSRSHILVLMGLAVGAGMAAAAEQEMNARDVFRSARDRFYKENPQAAPSQTAASQTAPPPTSGTQAARRPAEQAPSRRPERAPDQRPHTAQRPDPDAPVLLPVVDRRPVLNPVTDAPLGLRYSLLRQTKNGSVEEVDVDTVFHSGDRIRIRLESTDMAYLYILAKGASGRWRALFPAEGSGQDHTMRPDESQVVPQGGWFAFDHQAGEERVFVMLSRKRVDDLDQAIARLRRTDRPQPATAPAAQDVPVMLAMHTAGARDLVFEKVDTAEHAAYVATKTGGPDSHVVAELTLKHR